MKRWLLTIGVMLLILGCVFVILPPQIFNQFMDLVGLSETTYNSTTLIEKVVEVPPSKMINLPYYNQSFYINKGFSIVGNFTVIIGSSVSVFGFDNTVFKSWSNNRSGEPLFFTVSSKNSTFSYKFKQNDTYNFVFVKSEEGASTIILLSLNLVEEKHGPSIYALILGPILIAIGAIIIMFRIQPDILQPRIMRKDQEYAQMKATIQVAKTLGIPIKGKTIEQIRQDIKDYMDKEKQNNP